MYEGEEGADGVDEARLEAAAEGRVQGVSCVGRDWGGDRDDAEVLVRRYEEFAGGLVFRV